MPSDRPSRLQTIVSVVVLITGVFVMIGFPVVIYLRQQDAATAADQRHLVQQSIAASARADCRAEISGWFSIIDRRANTLGRSLVQQRAAGELQGIDGVRPGQDQIDLYDQTQQELKVANEAVDSLPNLQVAADHGWTPTAETRQVVPDLPARFAPCPTVS